MLRHSQAIISASGEISGSIDSSFSNSTNALLFLSIVLSAVFISACSSLRLLIMSNRVFILSPLVLPLLACFYIALFMPHFKKSLFLWTALN